MESQVKLDPTHLIGPQKVKTALTCPICLLVLTVPIYRCEECGNHFCKDCLLGWWKSKNKELQKECIYGCKETQIKLIKKSPTLVTMLDLLEFPCLNKDCNKVLAYEFYKKHTQLCEFKELNCDNVGCQEKITRKVYNDHKQICKFQLLPCQYCHREFKRGQLNAHEETCDQKEIGCEYQGCLLKIKRKQYNLHIHDCIYQTVKCGWCQIKLIRKDLLTHNNICENREINCPGCTKGIKQHFFQAHINQCESIETSCELCEKIFTRRELRDHSIQECMIRTIKSLKKDNQKLFEQNLHLKMNVQKLEQLVDQINLNKEKQITKSVIVTMRDQEYSFLEKDLQRIEYSVKSIQKLKQQQVENHMKIPHVFSGWCIICKGIEKKYTKMFEPLLQKKKECMTKLSQITRYKETRKG